MERQEIPLFPLNLVLFPGMLLPLHIFEPRYKAMLKFCLGEQIDFGVVLLKSGRAEGPLLGDTYEVGTTAQIKQVDSVEGDRFNIVTTGGKRFRIVETHPHRYAFLTATIEYFPIMEERAPEALTLAHKIAPLISRYLELFKATRGERFKFGQMPTDPLTLAYLAGVILPVENDVKQEILSLPDAYSILNKEYHLLQHETLILQMINDTRPAWATSDALPYYPN
jgi:uncharacterized protein